MRRVSHVVTTVLAALAALGWLLEVDQAMSWNILRLYTRPTILLQFALTMTIAALAGWVICELLERRADTRCRRCRQVLRGLREPRCPGCGEPL